MPSQSTLKYIALLGLSVLCTSMTVVFGALPMRVVRLKYGRARFWLGHLLMAVALLVAGLAPYSVLLFAMTVMVGVYTEVEQHGHSVFQAGLIGIISALGAASFFVGLNLYRTKANFLAEIRREVQPAVERLAQLNPQSELSADLILQQMPSAILVGFIIALALALIFERRLMVRFGLLNDGMLVSNERLLMFRAPDLMIWLTMLSFLGVFYQHNVEWLKIVSSNLLNVFVILFFFQGLGIVAQAFRTFRVGPFWQVFWYIMIVIQLFLVVSVIGFADFWFDFREKLQSKPAGGHP